MSVCSLDENLIAADEHLVLGQMADIHKDFHLAPYPPLPPYRIDLCDHMKEMVDRNTVVTDSLLLDDLPTLEMP